MLSAEAGVMKKVIMRVEYSRIFHAAKWMMCIKIWNFSSKRKQDNIKLRDSMIRAINKYNKGGEGGA